MEDDHLHLLGIPGAPDISLFGVYDGHGGDFVAHYVAKKFPEHLLRAGSLRGSDAELGGSASRAFELALMSIDAELLRQPEVESGQDQSGSTSVMTLIGPKHIVRACVEWGGTPHGHPESGSKRSTYRVDSGLRKYG